MEQRELKSAEIKINIKGDTGNLSMMQIVFDPLRPTEVFNGIKQAEHDLRIAFKKAGILTEFGVGVGEANEYLEYMNGIIDKAEQGVYQLYHVLAEVKDSELECRFILEDMIQERIDEANKVIDEYYSIFDEVKTVEVTEWEKNRPQTVVEPVEDVQED